MKKLTWFIGGIFTGFIAAHFINQTPTGNQFFTRVNRGITEFQRALATGYHEADSETPAE